ncbi:MAG: hypothetical protein SWN10_24840, partial [Pseudomonadota bacterium]|nr:hypothetical protein [Pseudomonadota bacterium]
PDGEVSGLGDHQHERALQSNPVPRPLHDANPKLTRAWPLTLSAPVAFTERSGVKGIRVTRIVMHCLSIPPLPDTQQCSWFHV